MADGNERLIASIRSKWSSSATSPPASSRS